MLFRSCRLMKKGPFLNCSNLIASHCKIIFIYSLNHCVIHPSCTECTTRKPIDIVNIDGPYISNNSPELFENKDVICRIFGYLPIRSYFFSRKRMYCNNCKWIFSFRKKNLLSSGNFLSLHAHSINKLFWNLGHMSELRIHYRAD